MADFYAPPKEVVDLVEEVMKRYHEELEDAHIGVLFRDEAPESDGKITLGMAKKVKDEERAAGLKYHFIIWFAEDKWWTLTDHQRAALVDHELCHCVYDDAERKAKIRKHDFEEFNCIIQRYGFWWPGAQETRQAVEQMKIPLALQRWGTVEAINGAIDKAVEKVLEAV